MEDYLETIAFLKKQKGEARVKDIGLIMKVKKPSVTGALNWLAKSGLVIHEPYGSVELTFEGRRLARKIQKKHNILTKFLSQVLKLDSRIAVEDACRMEHAISPETLERIEELIKVVIINDIDKGSKPHTFSSLVNELLDSGLDHRGRELWI